MRGRDSVEAADASDEPAKKAPGSCRPGRGFGGRAYPVRRQEKSEPASTTQGEKDEKAVEPVAREQKPVEPQLEVDAEAKGQQPTDEQTEQGRVEQASPPSPSWGPQFPCRDCSREDHAAERGCEGRGFFGAA